MGGRTLCLQKVINSPRRLCSFVVITGLQSVQFSCSVLGCIFLLVIQVFRIYCVIFHCVLEIDSTLIYFSQFSVVVGIKSLLLLLWSRFLLSPNKFDRQICDLLEELDNPLAYILSLCQPFLNDLLALCFLLAQISIHIQLISTLVFRSTLHQPLTLLLAFSSILPQPRTQLPFNHQPSFPKMLETLCWLYSHLLIIDNIHIHALCQQIVQLSSSLQLKSELPFAQFLLAFSTSLHQTLDQVTIGL